MFEKYTVLFSKNRYVYMGMVVTDMYDPAQGISIDKEILLHAEDSTICEKEYLVGYYNGEGSLYFGSYEHVRSSNAEVVFIAKYKYNEDTHRLELLTEPFIADAYIM